MYTNCLHTHKIQLIQYIRYNRLTELNTNT